MWNVKYEMRWNTNTDADTNTNIQKTVLVLSKWTVQVALVAPQR